MSSTNNVATNKHENSILDGKPNVAKLLGGLATITGLGALIASSCCVLPLVLAAVGASASVFSAYQYMAEWRYAFLGIAGVSVLGGWYAWWQKRNADCCSQSECSSSNRSNTIIVLLVSSTALIVLALSWEYLEPLLLKVIKGRI